VDDHEIQIAPILLPLWDSASEVVKSKGTIAETAITEMRRVFVKKDGANVRG